MAASVDVVPFFPARLQTCLRSPRHRPRIPPSPLLFFHGNNEKIIPHPGVPPDAIFSATVCYRNTGLVLFTFVPQRFPDRDEEQLPKQFSEASEHGGDQAPAFWTRFSLSLGHTLVTAPMLAIQILWGLKIPFKN